MSVAKHPVKKMKIAYWSVATLALVNAFIFIISLIENSDNADITLYRHYNLVLSFGYSLVFIISRRSRRPIGLIIALFLFGMGLIVASENFWQWIQCLLVLPIILGLLASLKIRRPELRSGRTESPSES